ncbi:MAG: TMEM175 family protein [Betaproteobacteria bacterium]
MVDSVPLPKSRLEALTDGIFSVTMTLLVLNLQLPPHVLDRDASVFHVLGGMLDRLDNYVISFVALCVFWLAHLRLLRRLREPDQPFVWLNLAFLLLTTFVPFLTSLVGENPTHPRAAILYGANLTAITAVEALMWRRMCLRLANETVEDAQALWRTVRKRYLIAIGVLLAAIVAALVEIRLGMSEGVAVYLYLFLLVVGAARPMFERPRHAVVDRKA